MKKAPKYQWLFMLILLGACIGIAKQYEVDFRTIYEVASVKNVAESYVQQANQAGRYFYGPFSLILIRPFGWFDFVTSKWIWIFLQTICFFTLFHYLYKQYPLFKKSFAFWLLGFIFLINPVHNNFQSNNIQLMLMAALWYAESLTEKDERHQFFAGMIVSLLASIKIFPAFIAAYYLVTKKKSVSYGLAAGAVFALLSPFAFFGIDNTLRFYHDFIANVSTYSADNELTRRDILSLPSLIASVTEGKEFFGKQYITPILFACISIFFFLLAYVSRGLEKTHKQTWALALLVMAVLTPSARVHFWVFCIPAFCEVLTRVHKTKSYRKPSGIMLLLSLAMVAFTTQAVVGREWNDYLEHARVPLLGLFLIAEMLLEQVANAIHATLDESQALG